MWPQKLGKKMERRFEDGCDVMVSWLKFLVVSVFLFSLVSVSVPWVSAVNGDMMSLEVAEAEEALVSAYDAVLEAEEAGANVSGLLDKLNVGSEYLAEASVYVRLGDSESAARLAGLCVEAVDDVEGEAVLLRDEAVKFERADFLARVVGSAVGVVIVVVGGFVLWTVFRRRYLEKVLGSRPEVVSDES
jgi:hypothetical protein